MSSEVVVWHKGPIAALIDTRWMHEAIDRLEKARQRALIAKTRAYVAERGTRDACQVGFQSARVARSFQRSLKSCIRNSYTNDKSGVKSRGS